MPKDYIRGSVALVAPFPPKMGGVTVQALLLTSYLEQIGLQVVRVDTNVSALRRPLLRWLLVLAQPTSILWQLITQSNKYEVAHFLAASYWGFMPAIVGVPVCRSLGKRCVVSYLGGQGPQFIDRFPLLTKCIFRLAAATTVCSTELKNEFERRDIECEFVANTFDFELFKPRKRNAVKRRVVWTRTFEDAYDPMTAVKAFEIVKSRYADAFLVMTNEGSMLPEVRKYILEQGIADVSLLGRIPKEDVARVMQEADICINTSKLDGTPTALLEAAGTGLPIITTPVGGIPTEFEDGVSAVMFPVGDPEALANAVIDLIENPDRADQLGNAAREVAMSHTWERLEKTWLRIYGFCDRECS